MEIMAGKKGKKAPEGKYIKLPGELWAVVEADAERCKRSLTKQIDAILTEYYRLDGVGLRDLTAVREHVSPGLQLGPSEQGTIRVPVYETVDEKDVIRQQLAEERRA